MVLTKITNGDLGEGEVAVASNLRMSDLVFPFAQHTYMLSLKSRQKLPSQLVLVEQVALWRESFFVNNMISMSSHRLN